jgi:hypothetical protein
VKGQMSQDLRTQGTHVLGVPSLEPAIPGSLSLMSDGLIFSNVISSLVVLL